MLGNLSGWHLLIIIAVVLLLFGAPKLPGLARSLGQSMRIFNSEVKQKKDDDKPAHAQRRAGARQAQPVPARRGAARGRLPPARVGIRADRLG